MVSARLLTMTLISSGSLPSFMAVLTFSVASRIESTMVFLGTFLSRFFSSSFSRSSSTLGIILNRLTSLIFHQSFILRSTVFHLLILLLQQLQTPLVIWKASPKGYPHFPLRLKSKALLMFEGRIGYPSGIQVPTHRF